MKKDIYALVNDNGYNMSKDELITLVKETAFKLWTVLDDDNEAYFKACDDILINVYDDDDDD